MKRISYYYDVILFLVAAGLYAPSLRYGFVGDDLIYFIGNRYIESFDVLTILSSGATGADYLPLRDLSFALDHLLWGDNPFWFHLTNVVLYGVTAVEVKHLFLRLNSFLTGPNGKKADAPAFLAALLFAINPPHRDVVCAVFNRGALMTVLFAILACMHFLRYLQRDCKEYRSYALALFFYVCALMSREYSIILPLVLVLLILFGDRSRRPGHLVRTIPFFITAALLFFTYRHYALAANYLPPATGPFPAEIIDRITVALKIIVFYILQTFLIMSSAPNAVIHTLAAAGVIAGVLFVAIILRRPNPQLLFGFLFYLICLIPVLNFFKTEPVVAQRYAYLPSLGLFFALLAIPFSGKKKFIPVLIVTYTAFWLFLARDDLTAYKNNIAYWENTVPYVQTAEVYKQLGYAYYEGQQYEKALKALRKVRPVPAAANYHTTVGYACYRLGDYKCAVQYLETAAELGANDFSVILTLVSARMAMGETDHDEKYPGPVNNKFP